MKKIILLGLIGVVLLAGCGGSKKPNTRVYLPDDWNYIPELLIFSEGEYDIYTYDVESYQCPPAITWDIGKGVKVDAIGTNHFAVSADFPVCEECPDCPLQPSTYNEAYNIGVDETTDYLGREFLRYLEHFRENGFVNPDYNDIPVGFEFYDSDGYIYLSTVWDHKFYQYGTGDYIYVTDKQYYEWDMYFDGVGVIPTGSAAHQNYEVNIEDREKIISFWANDCISNFEGGSCASVFWKDNLFTFKDWATESGYYELTDEQIELLKDNCMWDYWGK